MQFLKNPLNKSILLLITTIFLFGFKAKHPFYLGVTHFKHNSASKTIETSVKLFVNDLEDALKRTTNQKIDLINGVDKNVLNKAVSEYLNKHLTLKLDNKIQELKYLGFEIEKDVVWIYSEINKISAFKNASVENTLLYEYLPQQVNIIRFEYKGKDISTKLSNPEKSAVFSF